MKRFTFLIIAIMTLSFTACNNGPAKESEQTEDFKFLVDQFADLKIMRYQVPGFEDLTLKQKELVYYLSQAALCGRDILFDQNYKYNLAIRRTLESIVENYRQSLVEGLSPLPGSPLLQQCWDQKSEV